MIVGHHMGEELIPGLVMGTTAVASVMLVVVRDRMTRLGRRFRRRQSR